MDNFYVLFLLLHCGISSSFCCFLMVFAAACYWLLNCILMRDSALFRTLQHIFCALSAPSVNQVSLRFSPSTSLGVFTWKSFAPPDASKFASEPCLSRPLHINTVVWQWPHHGGRSGGQGCSDSSCSGGSHGAVNGGIAGDCSCSDGAHSYTSVPMAVKPTPWQPYGEVPTQASNNSDEAASSASKEPHAPRSVAPRPAK